MAVNESPVVGPSTSTSNNNAGGGCGDHHTTANGNRQVRPSPLIGKLMSRGRMHPYRQKGTIVSDDECPPGLERKPVVDVFLPTNTISVCDKCINQIVNTGLHGFAGQTGFGMNVCDQENYNVRFINTNEQSEMELDVLLDAVYADEARENKMIIDDCLTGAKIARMSQSNDGGEDDIDMRDPLVPNPVGDDDDVLPRPESAPILSAEMIQTTRDKLADDHWTCRVSLDDLLTLSNREWLNDVVVDAYLELIRARNLNHMEYLKVYPFEGVFYTMLSDDDDGIEQAARTTGDEDIFTYDLAFFPVCVTRHWRLVVANFREHALDVYNSRTNGIRWLRNNEDKEIWENVEKYLVSERERKGGAPIKWIRSMNSERPPQQNNCDDCGVFTLQFAEYLSRKRPFDFGHQHMPYFRERMIYEVLEQRLLIQ